MEHVADQMRCARYASAVSKLKGVNSYKGLPKMSCRDVPASGGRSPSIYQVTSGYCYLKPDRYRTLWNHEKVTGNVKAVEAERTDFSYSVTTAVLRLT